MVVEQEEIVTAVWLIFEEIAKSVSMLNEKVEQMHQRFTIMSVAE